RATATVTDVVATPGSRNVIPDTAVVVVDWRVLPGLDAAEGLRRLEAFLAERIALPDGLELSVRYAAEEQRTWTGLSETR
ncbi:MAG: peptidase dimerization domain-containing protein, partial [Gemmatimonadetes bacterium]|nr:peptidase dimerization domain-containing protein [Gemmatimonadota bacterium]NIQ59209.1 peptidase dimerization domain-containing protein [Gemmatimonadota bacterium]NIU79391.1 peptidase dimerization domain-containing protein [Gammaproteobacteria bacterium]NIX44798.1 peptidase dimerization domain-containing protein [Gemmatimonadota bacterium]NIY13144.1 peptidase dimerization domain-containing protein [Gemmatimonadota bacterium]